MSVVKAVTFGKVADTDLGHVLCLVHHQRGYGRSFFLPQNSGTDMTQSKVLEVAYQSTAP